MIGKKQAAELLKREWREINSFAADLYAIVSSPHKKEIESPVEIRVQKGVTALRIVATDIATTVVKAAKQAQAQTPAQRVADLVAEVARRDSTDVSSPKAQATQEKPKAPEAREPDLPRVTQPARPVTSSDIRTVLLAPAIKSAKLAPFNPFDPPPPPLPTPSDEDVRLSIRSGLEARQSSGTVPHFTSAPQGAFPVKGPGPDDSGVVPDVRQPQAIQPFKGQQPRANSTVEIVGSVTFSGRDPVEFEVEPSVWSKRYQSYRPMTEWAAEELTHIKRARQNYDPMVGKVVSGTGNIWRVRIYNEGPNDQSAETQDTEVVEVTVLNMPPDYKIPEAGTWIGPLLQFPSRVGADENDWFFAPSPGWFGGKIAKTKVGGISAQNPATGEPGSGQCDLYTWDRVPGHAPTLWKSDVTVYNGIGSISSDKWVLLNIIDGSYFVDVARCAD